MSTPPPRPPADPRLDFAEGPRLELDQLLRQLIDRAQDVMRAQGRLRALLAANESLLGALDLPVVLRRIVEASCALVKARYGALGVLSPSGEGFEQVITVGMDAAQVTAIRRALPELSAATDDRRPVRLAGAGGKLAVLDPAEGHPAVSSLLAVPVRVRDEIFGNLYLTENEDGAFNADDEELVAALAATAGIVIENARLFDQARRRQEWLGASARVTRQLLAVGGEDALTFIAQEARQLADADLVSIVLPEDDGQTMRVEVVAGERADDLVGYRYPAENSLAQVAVDEGKPLMLADSQHGTWPIHLVRVMNVGPVMAIPLVGMAEVRGAMVVGRRHRRPRFDEADLDMATTFANHAAIALELATARADQHRMALLEDRDRIARDLHDHVIQRLFAAGLSVNALGRQSKEEQSAARLSRIAGDLDDTIRQIRTSIFQLRGPLGPEIGALRTRVLEIAKDMAGPLGFQPTVRFAGPVDAVVSDSAVDDVLAVVRETLSNVARHAVAGSVEVEVAVDSGEISVSVSDDGAGMGETARRSGLGNLRRRAERHRGRMTITSPRKNDPDLHGTLVEWVIPLAANR